MGKLIITCVFITLAQILFAQQKPQYTQYLFNSYLLNPALTGIEDFTDIKIGNRTQWTGLEGAPTTNYFTINTPLGKFDTQESDTTQIAGNLFAPRTTTSKPHHGLGMLLMSDKAGLIGTINLQLSYAYHLKLTYNLNLATGLYLGLNHTSFNGGLATLENTEDMAIQNTSGNYKPDIGVGVLLYNNSFHIGLSIQQIVPQLYLETKEFNLNSKTVPHLLLNACYKIHFGENFVFSPSLLLKIVSPVPISYDANMKVMFKNKVWLGASYRRNDSYGILMGTSINHRFHIGYAYDITSSPLKAVNSGSHEVVVGLMLNKCFRKNSEKKQP